jgi:hypothetical protein
MSYQFKPSSTCAKKWNNFRLEQIIQSSGFRRKEIVLLIYILINIPKRRSWSSKFNLNYFWFKSCVHISTAYVHCYRADIDEVIYRTNENPTVLLEAIEWFDDKIFDHLSKRSLKEFPNTYTYTKSLAEYLISEQANDLPIGKTAIR